MQSEKRKKLFLIEKGYYDLIDKYFKDMLKEFNAMTAIEWQRYIAKYLKNSNSSMVIKYEGKYVNSICYKVNAFLREIYSFWNGYRNELEDIIKCNESCIQVGNIDANPLQYEEDIRKYGLFFETLCIQDPFYVKASNNVHYDNMTVNITDYITFFNCIYSMKKIEKYVLLDCDLDIALIMPTFGFEFGDKKFRCIDEKTSEMANEYMALFLGYDSFDLDTIIKRIENISRDEIISILTKNGLFPEWDVQQMQAEENLKKLRLGSKNVDSILKYTIFHSSIHSSLLTLSTSEYQAENVGINLLLKKDDWFAAEKLHSGAYKALGMPEQLKINYAFEHRDLEWSSNIELDDLLTLRKDRLLSDIKQVFRECSSRIDDRFQGDFNDLANEFFENLYRCIDNARQEIKKINRNKKISSVLFGANILTTFCGLLTPYATIPALILAGTTFISAPSVYDSFIKKNKKMAPILFLVDIVDPR